MNTYHKTEQPTAGTLKYQALVEYRSPTPHFLITALHYASSYEVREACPGAFRITLIEVTGKYL